MKFKEMRNDEMTKKILCSILILALCLSLCACGNSSSSKEQATETTAETTPTETIDDTHFQATTSDGTTVSIEKPKDVAEVTKNDGTVEITNCLELSQIYSDNQIKFEKNYLGAFVKITAPVDSIHGRTIYNGRNLSSYVELSGGWVVEVDENNPLLEDLSRGDMVVATGLIHRAGVGAGYGGVVMIGRCEVFSTDDVKTTLELYTD